MADPRPIFRQIVIDELGACKGGADRLLVYPSLQGLWEGGLSFEDHLKVRKTSDDLSWWFVEEFASPEVAQAVKRILDSVPSFYFKIASLSKSPLRVDWNYINQLRNHLRTAAWPPPYDVATGSTKSEASQRAGQLISRLTSRREWQKKS